LTFHCPHSPSLWLYLLVAVDELLFSSLIPLLPLSRHPLYCLTHMVRTLQGEDDNRSIGIMAGVEIMTVRESNQRIRIGLYSYNVTVITLVSVTKEATKQ
jgi:hypothetical protein